MESELRFYLGWLIVKIIFIFTFHDLSHYNANCTQFLTHKEIPCFTLVIHLMHFAINCIYLSSRAHHIVNRKKNSKIFCVTWPTPTYDHNVHSSVNFFGNIYKNNNLHTFYTHTYTLVLALSFNKTQLLYNRNVKIIP